MQLKMGNRLKSFIASIRKSNRTNALLIIITIIISVTANSSIAILLSTKNNLTVLSKGNLKTIGIEVYSDPNREQKIESINWNDVWLGTTKNVTIYIRSISNYKISLNLKSTEWNPDIFSEYATLSWNYNGTTINPNDIVEVTLTLTIRKVSQLISHILTGEIQKFNLDIQITAVSRTS